MTTVASYPTLSRAQSVNMHRVWSAASRIADKKGGAWDGFVTIGEVVKETQMARATVKKYLGVLCEYEKLSHWTYQKQVNLYQILVYAEGYK